MFKFKYYWTPTSSFDRIWYNLFD